MIQESSEGRALRAHLVRESKRKRKTLCQTSNNSQELDNLSNVGKGAENSLWEIDILSGKTLNK